MENPLEFGPQYPKDPPFTARMRFHQSWYRARVLKVPYGIGPKPGNKTSYGNMLTQADGNKGLNFLQAHIFQVAKRRLAESKGLIDPFRLLCNLLSSQPMCFNLFAPLVDDFEQAAELLKPMFPTEIERVDKVRLEYAPEPANEYLNDRTAFDAFVEYTRPDGSQAFIGIETKLSEDFSQKSYAQPAYWKRTRTSDSPWPEAAWPRLLDKDVNQLWRDHLLAVALRRHPESIYSRGQFLLVYHPQDADAVRHLHSYQALLKPEDETFRAMPLDRLVDFWMKAAARPADRTWLAAFTRRYLDLSESEGEFRSNSRGVS